jgi:hypothetical protein
MMMRREKENGEFYGYHSMLEVEMMTIEGMTHNSLQA